MTTIGAVRSRFGAYDFHAVGVLPYTEGQALHDQAAHNKLTYEISAAPANIIQVQDPTFIDHEIESIRDIFSIEDYAVVTQGIVGAFMHISCSAGRLVSRSPATVREGLHDIRDRFLEVSNNTPAYMPLRSQDVKGNPANTVIDLATITVPNPSRISLNILFDPQWSRANRLLDYALAN
jgi:hypothetical protein